MNRLRWLTAGAAMVAAAAIAQTQMPLPPDLNLFGDGAGLQIQRPPLRRGTTDKIAPPAYEQILIFGDGRQLHGALEEITADEIVWRRPDAGALLHFPRNTVWQIATSPLSLEANSVFSKGPPRRAQQAANATFDQSPPLPATLKLPGGDWLFGDISSADGQSFTVHLEDGTPLTIPRAKIEWLAFAPSPAPAFGFSGTPLDLEGWLPSNGVLEVAGETMTVNGTPWIGHPVSSPTRFELAFDLPEDGEEGTGLLLQPYGPSPHSYGPGTVELRFGRKQISRLLFIDKFDRQVSPLPQEAMEQHGPVHYRVFYDKTARRVVVRRNGRELGDWKFSPETDGQIPGARASEIHVNSICFNRANNEGNLRFNRLVIRPWNGVLPEESRTAGSQDQLYCGDAPVVVGKLESVTDKGLLFSGETHAWQANTFVQFPNAPASLTNADVKLQLGRQGEFSARHLEIREGRVHCETAFATTLDMPLSALQTLTFPWPQPPPDAPADVLVFRNGDELRGEVLAASADGPVRWKSSDEEELEFQPGRIAGIRLAAGSPSKDAGDHPTIELRSGERLRARVVALDEKQLKLQHDLLGDITLDRSQLWHLYPNPQYAVTEGGRDPEEWMRSIAPPTRRSDHGKTAKARPWGHLDGIYFRYTDGKSAAFDLNQSLGLQREISSSLERFEVRLEETSAVSLFLSGANRGASLRATIYYDNLSLYVFNPAAHAPANFRNLHLQDKLPEVTPRLSLRLFVDLGKGTSDFFINGVLMAHLGQSPNERLTKSTYTLQIQPHPNGSFPSVFSNLWIGPWNGELPRSAVESSASTSLVNGDMAPGLPKEFHDGKLCLDGDVGPLEIPLEKVLLLDFGGGLLAEHSAARIRLADGTTVNADAFQWDGHELKAHSATLGDIRLPLGAVTELIYHPALPRAPMNPEPKQLAQKVLAKPETNIEVGK